MQSDPLTQTATGNPYPHFARLQQERPLYWSEGYQTWVVSRHDDIVALLRDPRLSSARFGDNALQQAPAALRPRLAPIYEFMATWLVALDPPEHSALRALLGYAFTPRFTAQLAPRIQAHAEALLAAVAGQKERFDLMASFATPLPALVIADLLGIPATESARLQRWSRSLTALGGSGGVAALQAMQQTIDEMRAYLPKVIAAQRAQPADTLISHLAQQQELGQDTVVATCAFLLLVGHETTSNVLGSGLHALLQQPSAYQGLLTDPSLLEGAVEEILRYHTSVQHVVRVAREPIEIAGQLVPAGASLTLLLGAANHDPSHFTCPHHFMVERSPNRHVSFGQGIHYCLGASLARLELRVALAALLRHLPTLRLADTAQAGELYQGGSLWVVIP